MKNEATIGGIRVGGQPSPSELDAGAFAQVINVRMPGEEGNETASMLDQRSAGYTEVPYTIDTVTREDIEKVRAAVESAGGPVLIH